MFSSMLSKVVMFPPMSVALMDSVPLQILDIPEYFCHHLTELLALT